ncbi:sulfatase family protein [Limnofasciculus baicalensis]|uniref:Sulfatase-like hydrolase/transferase n=1 Tax=Limnofasciculus baicalensis BBK-W-15 TaxID=2699891 RepID=A0AAE3GV48_9CYAN|nr:sulfatase-like hydrolase/transferase [Limnofasciculus baicalensis]MCP2731270.1 sulfatase-like hydrolase/transferase [Limnofasciculus baicalensis BBK-W-15]
MNKRKLPAISRRQFLGTAITSTVLTLGGLSVSSAVAATQKRPNILFILTDDLGWGDIGIYGKTYQTPNLDQLAREGTRFTNAYAAQTVCTPTRISFFTGRYPARLPVALQEPLVDSDNVGLPPQHPTIASLLKANGYQTALVGKWHAGFLPNYSPLKSGFDEFFGNYSGAIDYFTHKNESEKLDFYEGEVLVDKPGYATDLYTERAVEFLTRPRNKPFDNAQGEPFYLSLHYNAPHWPWERPEDEELSRTFYSSNDITAGGSKETYAAILKRLDDGVGKVLQALKDSGQADNTIVIFASDNGGEKFSDIGPFQGRKTSLYEGGIRVPTFIRWPGVIQPNQVNNQVLITFDLTATILAATGTSPDPDYPLDGRNLLPVLVGKKPVSPRTLFWRYKSNESGYPSGQLQAAVRSGDWKYLRQGEKEYLFNLANDEGEQTDLKDNNPDVLKRLRNRFEEWNGQVLPYPA